MSETYRLPTAVRLQFSADTDAHAPADAIAESVDAQWQRAYLFWDCGYSDGLKIAWGMLTGELTATDLMLATDYSHATTFPSVLSDTLWLPGELNPVDAGALNTIDIALFFDPDGATGDAMLTFPCVARPEQISPRQLMDGLEAAVVAWRWEIRDDTPPVIST